MPNLSLIHRKHRRFALAAATVVAAVLGHGAISSAAPRSGPFPVPVGIAVTASRTVAASGQVIEYHGGGCVPGAHPVVVSLFEGDAADFATQYPVAGDEVEADPDGTFTVSLVLLASAGDGGFEPLPDGAYTAVAWCVQGGGYVRSEAQPVTISGAKPSGDIEVAIAKYYGTFDLSGGSCSGATVSLDIRGYGSEYPGDEQFETVAIAPEPDGSWTFHWEGPTLGSLLIDASCGDPAGDGFRYRQIVAEIVYATTTTTAPTTSTSGSSSTTTVAPGAGPVAAAAVPVAGTANYAG